MSAYYNEIDPYAAQWLRNLIAAGHIAKGEVDERDIRDIRPAELAGFTQCHFFAGIGVWSLALRGAGWEDDRPVWTGSCPCQPFSEAGAGAGFADERHLWPHWFHLIGQCRPAIIFGEQVAAEAGLVWADLVQDDLETLAYAFGQIAFPAASVGAPHIRDRNYWMAYADHDRQQGLEERDPRSETGEPAQGRGDADGCGLVCPLADASGDRRQAGRDAGTHQDAGAIGEPERLRDAGELGHSEGGRCRERRHEAQPGPGGHADGAICASGELGVTPGEGLEERQQPEDGAGIEGHKRTAVVASSPLFGFWADAEWIECTDGRARPVEPGTFPLAHGITNRVGRLRAYGNGLNAPQAQRFIEAAKECLPCH